MIIRKELNPHSYPETAEVSGNLDTLLQRINVVRTAWGRPMTVTSGLRSQADQDRINPGAPKSKHLIGAAVDIADSTGDLYRWLKSDPSILERAQLWCEAGTIGWCHFQIFPPKSGKRWFLP